MPLLHLSSKKHKLLWEPMDQSLEHRCPQMYPFPLAPTWSYSSSNSWFTQTTRKYWIAVKGQVLETNECMPALVFVAMKIFLVRWSNALLVSDCPRRIRLRTAAFLRKPMDGSDLAHKLVNFGMRAQKFPLSRTSLGSA